MREVRCCCDGRLMGYLPSHGVEGDVISFPLSRYPVMGSGDGDEVAMDKMELEVAMIGVAPRTSHLAYKSRDYPLERLQRISQWVDFGPGVGSFD